MTNNDTASAPPAPTPDAGSDLAKLSAGTDDLVDRFALALKARLAVSSDKPGRGEAWASVDWQFDCQMGLVRHVAKGDPLDVAAYAAFCWHHDWITVLPDHPSDEKSAKIIREAAARIEQLSDSSPAPSRPADREKIAKKAADFRAQAKRLEGAGSCYSADLANAVADAYEDALALFAQALRDAPRNGGDGWRDTQRDAERFRALMRCGRIKMQGSAGVNPDTGERTYADRPGSVHFGAEFWPTGDKEADRITAWGRHCLRALADDILAVEAPPSPNAGDGTQEDHR